MKVRSRSRFNVSELRAEGAARDSTAALMQTVPCLVATVRPWPIEEAATILASLASARSNSAVRRPWLMTATRSESARTSSRSDVTNKMPMPCAARRRMMRNTSPLAPMSMPRLGSSINSTLGSVISALPMTTFCWLPPESDETGRAGSATLIDRSRTSRCTCSASRRAGMWKTFASFLRLARVRFSATERIGTSPSRWRSSGMSARPRAMRPPTSRSRTGLPSTNMRPVAWGCRPMTHSRNSLRPAPIRP